MSSNDGFLPVGADSNISCGPNASFVPVPELYCLFDQIKVPATISAPAYSSDPVNKQSYLQCLAPPLSQKGAASNYEGIRTLVKIGMNPSPPEFSNSLRFVLSKHLVTWKYTLPTNNSLNSVGLSQLVVTVSYMLR